MSVPRLELIAALLLARLLDNVKHSLESQILFESIYCWSNSTIVLSWLKNDRNYKQFVSNRTKNILKLTSPEIWNHCSTEDNAADIGTKGKSAAELKNSSLWWTGPEWFKGLSESYPLQLAPQELESDNLAPRASVAFPQKSSRQVDIPGKRRPDLGLFSAILFGTN